MTGYRVERLEGPTDRDVAQLAEVMVDCVDGGASVNFLRPLEPAAAEAWWRGALADPASITWVARDADDRVVGCVRLSLAQQPNGLHRAEVGKLLVHRRARGHGVSRALMDALEAVALELGRIRLVLDTETGSAAEAVYQRLGWSRVGVVPDFCRSADGAMSSTTYYTKGLGEQA